MATLAALKNLGASIKADIREATAGVAAKIEHARSERRVIADFKAALRTDPARVAAAFVTINETPAKRPRRAAKKEAQA